MGVGVCVWERKYGLGRGGTESSEGEILGSARRYPRNPCRETREEDVLAVIGNARLRVCVCFICGERAGTVQKLEEKSQKE